MDLNEAYVLAARDSLTLSGFPSSAKKNPSKFQFKFDAQLI